MSKKMPIGSYCLESDYKTVKRGVSLERRIIKTWEMQVDAFDHTSLSFLGALAQKNLESAQVTLDDLRAKIVNIESSLYDAILEWEEYWGRPFPDSKIKAEAKAWSEGDIEEEKELETEEEIEEVKNEAAEADLGGGI